jgi:trimeric autotransporter adhesin
MIKLFTTFFILNFCFNSIFAQQKTQINPIPRTTSNVNYRVGCSLFNDINNYSSGTSFSYNAPINNNSNLTTSSGTNLGCMASVPNQAWFIISVNTGGNLYFNISNSNGFDIDAVIWGPIAGNNVANACASTQNSPATCDWDAGRPDLYLNGAQAGQKYVMLVTNYSNANTIINISQPAGGSVTYSMVNLPNCSLVPSASISGTSTTINEGQLANLNLSFTGSSPWNYTLSDGTMGSTFTSPTTVSVYPTSSQTYTINSVNNLCGTNGGSGSVGISVIRNVELKTCLPFDGNATDAQNLNTGNLQNGVLPTSNRSNEANKALQFDGINDYVHLPTNQLNNNTFSFASWVKLDELPSFSNPESIVISLGGTSDQHYLGVELANGSPSWKFSSNENNLYSNALVDLNWHLLVGVRSGGQLKLYVDGILTGTTAVSGVASYGSPLSARIGSGIANTKFFKGKIDDVKFFNGSLIEPEILLLQNYNSCNNVYNDTYISVQSVSTSVICTGSSFILRAFTNNITPDGQLQFTAELSDSNGSFINPTAIGTSQFLPLNVAIPNNISSGNYKIRIRYGGLISVNSFDIFVNNPATYNINGTVAINDGQSSNLTLNFTGSGPWNYIMSDGLSGVATTSPWLITVTPDQSTTYSISSAQNICGNAAVNGSSFATISVNYTKQFVSCLPFSGTAIDTKNNNTTTVNGPILTNNRIGQSNSAYAFNGSSNYIEYTTNLLRKREYTMSAWVLATSISGSNQYILSQGEIGTNTFQGLGVNSSGWFFQSYSNNGLSSVSNATSLITNQWVHLTAVRTYQSLKLFINGNLVSTISNSSIIPFKTSDIGRIGANSSTLGNFFNGIIDDVKLYKGALNDDEVFAMYLNTSDCPTIENAPIIVAKSISPATVCAGNSVSVAYSLSNVNVSSGAPLTVQLSDATGFFSNPTILGTGSTSPISVTIPSNILNSNFYRIRLVSAGNVTSVNAVGLVVSGSLPTATISGGGNIPFGGSATLSINFTGPGPWTYTLNNGASQSASSNPATVSVSPFGTITFTVTSVSNSCGAGTGIGSATVSVAPNIILGSIDNVFCQGESFILPFTSNFSASPNFRAELSNGNGSFANPINIGTGANGIISVTIPNNTPAGTAYKIRIVSNSPAYISPETSNLVINTKAVATISGTTTINEGESTNLTLNFTGTAPFTFAINEGSNQNTSLNTLNVSVSPTVNTTYQITSLSNTCGTGTFSGSAIINIAPKITIGVIPNIFCQGQSFNIPFISNFSASPNFRAELSNDNGSFANPINIGTGANGIISVTIPNNTPAGTAYKIRIVSNSPAYISPETSNLVINTKAVATISGTTTINEGESTNLTLNFTGTAPFTFAINGGNSQNTNLNILNVSVSPIVNTTYQITSLSNTCGTGTFSGSAIINIAPKITIGVIPNIFCQGQSFNIPFISNFSASPNFRAELSNGNGSFANPINIGTGANGIISVTIPNNTLAGTAYKIRIVSNSPAYISPETPNLVINTKAVATISGTTTINEGESTNLTLNFTGTAPYTYALNSGSNQTTSSNSITVNVAPIVNTTYQITSLSNICGTSLVPSSAVITVNPVPVRLVSCFPFNGNANDSKGLNNGSVYGASLTSDRFGNSNNAYFFNGQSSYIEASSSQLQNNNFTVSLWFNPSASIYNYQFLFSIQNSSSIFSSLIIELNNFFFNSSTNSTTTFPDITLVPNNWYFITCIRENLFLKIYLNGNLIKSTAINNSINSISNSRLFIGSINSGNGLGNFFGKIDDVQIYKGALNAGQVKALYQNINSCFDATTYTCLSDNILTSILSGQQTLQVSNQIIGRNRVQTGANIHFDSKNSVILEPGFTTETNSVFRATVGGGCD